jgi:hypothetical protein
MKKKIILKEIYLLSETFSRDGESGNILDNLLKRMEQYANNLEVSLIYFYIVFNRIFSHRVLLKNVQVIIWLKRKKQKHYFIN